MKVFLTTLGCRLNEAELATWSRSFARAGHDLVGAPVRAELMVVNTCAVTAEAARKSRKQVSRLHRANPSARLVVTGCFAALDPDRAASLAGVDLVVENAAKDRLLAEVEERLDVRAMPGRAADPDSTHVYPEPPARTRAFVKVQDGCRNRCSFCIVTTLRGDERSRPIAEVVAEIQDFARRGFREAVLTGVHLGGYGSDLGTDLAALVRAVLADTDIPRLRLSSLEPWDLPDDFGALWDSPRLMPHLHLPLQSGSDAVLRRMSRRCFAADYQRLVERLRDAIPDLSVTTDLIVGFPGETDAEHAETIATIERVGFAHMHVFPYSVREGTRAASLPGRVAPAVARARSAEVHALAARMKSEHLERFAGAARPVLWEGAGEVVGARAVRFRGYTDNYLRVRTTVSPDLDLQNRITRVELAAVDGGELVAPAPLSR